MPSDSRGYHYAEDTGVADLGVASSAITTTASIEAASPGTGALFIEYAVTAASGTSPTLNVSIEHSLDGTNWYESRSLTQFTAAATQRALVPCPGGRVRIRQTVGGTTPSFTRSVTVRFQDF